MFRIIAIACLLAGCASEKMLLPATAPETVTVTWARIEPGEIAFYCHRSNPAVHGAAVGACAVPMGSTCVIYTTKEPSFDVIGEELAHCYGWKH